MAQNNSKDFILDIKILLDPYKLIFSRDFAKAFWGTRMRYEMNGHYQEPFWQYRLKEMVLSKEPLKYLEKFLDEVN